MPSCSRLVIAALAVATVVSATGGRITVGRDATVSGDVVRLGDVATLDGAASRLAAVHLATAPPAGEVRTLDGAAVLGAISREAGSLDGIIYTIPATVRLRRASQEIGEAAVRQALEDFLAETLGASASDAVV